MELEPWQVGLPNAAAAVGDHVATVRGPALDLFAGGREPRHLRRWRHTQRLIDVVAVPGPESPLVFALDVDGGVVRADPDRLSTMRLPGPVSQIMALGDRVAALTKDGRVLDSEKPVRCIAERVDRLVPAPDGHLGMFDGPDRLVVLSRDGMVGERRCRHPRAVVAGHDGLFVADYHEGFVALAGHRTVSVGAPILNAAGGPVVTYSTLDGLWQLDLAEPSSPRRLGRTAARRLLMDREARSWAVYDDHIDRLASSAPPQAILRFVGPEAAVPDGDGKTVTVATARGTLGAVALGPLWDLAVTPDHIVGAGSGRVVVLDRKAGAAAGSVAVPVGHPARVRVNRWTGEIAVTAGNAISRLRVGCDVVESTYHMRLVPLCAVSAAGRTWIAAGEDGLYCTDGDGTHPVAGLGLEAAIDVCAVSATTIAVATGAAVALIDCVEPPRVAAKLPLPGVRSVDADGETLVALTNTTMTLATLPGLDRGRDRVLRNDGRTVRLAGRVAAVCGYDSVELEDIDDG